MLVLISVFLSESALWSHDAFSALCHVVTSCKNFKVRIKSAAALAVPTRRGCYGDAQLFSHVWHSLAMALENSEDTNDFLEYRYSASLRHTLLQALLHLLSLSQTQDMPALSAALTGEQGRDIKTQMVKYLGEEEEEGGSGVGDQERDLERDSRQPQQKIGGLQQTLIRLKEMKAEDEEGKSIVVNFLEDLLKMCEES